MYVAALECPFNVYSSFCMYLFAIISFLLYFVSNDKNKDDQSITRSILYLKYGVLNRFESMITFYVQNHFAPLVVCSVFSDRTNMQISVSQ